MKYLCLLVLLFYSINSFGQFDDYYQIRLNKGSKLLGKIVHETKKDYWLETNLSDTFYVKKSAIKGLYLIRNSQNSKGDVPVLIRGFYKLFSLGIGNGSRVTNPKLLDNSIFNPFPFRIFNPPNDISLYTPQSTLLTVYKTNFSMGYQINKYFGFGMGFNLDLLRQGKRLVGNVFAENTNFNPYFQGKFSYPLEGFGNKDLWMTVNIFRHTEIITGLSFQMPKRTYHVGLGWYRSYFEFKTENYFSLQAGFQF